MYNSATQVNDIDMYGKTREEAVLLLLGLRDHVSLLVQHRRFGQCPVYLLVSNVYVFGLSDLSIVGCYVNINCAICLTSPSVNILTTVDQICLVSIVPVSVVQCKRKV